MKKNNTLKSLITLLISFVLGYGALITTQLIFSKIIDDLDNKAKNEYSRYKIGEYILKEINAVEKHYYEMAIVSGDKSLMPIQEEIKHELDDIRKALKVLENGGMIKNYIKLNFLNIKETVEEIHYTPIANTKELLKAINLSPYLDDIEKKMIEIDYILELKRDLETANTKDEIKYKREKVEGFFKNIPPLFKDIKENSSRLLYESKKNLEVLENDIEKEKKYYKRLEFVVSYIAMALVIILGYIVIKQILRNNKELEEISKKAEESAQEASRANEIKSQFLANMSHEIRTPLNAIIGFSEILSNSKLNVEEKEKASIILKSAKSLLNIINDILDISKVESGKFELTNTSFNPKKTLEQIVELYSISTKQKNIRFIYNFDENIPSSLIGDETRIKQVLSNVVSNAIKFTPEGKNVTLEVKVVDIKNSKATIKFIIKDEGIGISPENQNKIFNPFSQADGSISRKFGGTGLGLAISLKIVQLMGSRINLVSKEGKGSTFYFELKLDVDEEPKKEEKSKPYNFAVFPLSNDSESLRSSLISTLKEYGKIIEDKKRLEKTNLIDLIFCFDDSHLIEEIEELKNRTNCNVVYVGDEKKLETNNRFQSLINYKLDVPIYGSKVFNIIAEACKIEESEIVNKDKNTNQFNGKILVAEDNANNQLLIELLLKNFGLDVLIVENGQLACQAYEKGDFDLVFLDINMPIMDGLTALKKIREYESNNKRYTPIVALTANTIKGDKETYLEEGMDYYLAKPIENDKLVNVLNLYLKKDSTQTTEDEIITIEKPQSTADKLDHKTVSDKLGVSENIGKMIINKFKSEVIKDLEELENLIKESKRDEIKEKAHYIKNSCLNVCLDEVCSMLQDIEKNNELDDKALTHRFKILKYTIESIIYKKD